MYINKDKIAKYSLLFAIGGAGYGAIEILYRGWTHWSMAIAGGICFIGLYEVRKKDGIKIWQKWLIGGLIITAVEFVTGCTVNLMLGWNVWDYSGRRFNIMGQICLKLTLCWVLLSIPAMALCAILDKTLFLKLTGRNED